MFLGWLRPYYAEDSGGDGGSDKDAESDPPAGERPKPSDLLARYGSDGNAALRMAEQLSTAQADNYKLREKNRQLREEVTGLRGKAAPEGAVVLSADDAKRWEAYQGLGMEPAALKAALTEGGETKQRLTALEREKVLRDVAEVAGYRYSVLKDLDTLAGGLEYTIGKTTRDGKEVETVTVKDGDKQVSLTDDYAPQRWKDHQGSLRAEPPTAQGTRYVEQSAGGRAPVQTPAQQHIKKTKYALPGKS